MGNAWRTEPCTHYIQVLMAAASDGDTAVASSFVQHTQYPPLPITSCTQPQMLVFLPRLAQAAYILLPFNLYASSAMSVQELDFKLEAANSRRCQANLNSKKSRVKGKVVVPQIEDGMVNHRVLVMEYVEGVKITDRLVFLLTPLVYDKETRTGNPLRPTALSWLPLLKNKPSWLDDISLLLPRTHICNVCCQSPAIHAYAKAHFVICPCIHGNVSMQGPDTGAWLQA